MAAGLPFQQIEESAGGLVAAQHGGGGADGGLAVPGAQLALVVAQIVAGVFMDTAHGRQHGGQRAQVGRQPLRIPAARAMQRVQDAAGGHFQDQRIGVLVGDDQPVLGPVRKTLAAVAVPAITGLPDPQLGQRRETRAVPGMVTPTGPTCS